MAGDWIKMRIDLQSHPKIVRILSATKADKFRTIGGLHAVWSVFDTHSTDGTLPGYTPDLMDHVIGWPGFSAAMIAVGWLEFDGAETLAMPEFDEHNGKSAKRRAEDAKRKKNGRTSEKRPQNVRKMSAVGADIPATNCGLEKRREEEKIKPATVVAQPSPDDYSAQLWAAWKAIPDSGGGAFLGKQIKAFDEQSVLEAVEKTIETPRADPKGFLVGLLRAKTNTDEKMDTLFRSAI